MYSGYCQLHNVYLLPLMEFIETEFIIYENKTKSCWFVVDFVLVLF